MRSVQLVRPDPALEEALENDAEYCRTYLLEKS